MNFILIYYSIYISITLILLILVGNTLFKNGKVFLFDIFNGDVELVEAINRLLLVGFYLINIGYVLAFLKVWGVKDWVTMIEKLSSHLGGVMIAVGIIHMFNIIILFYMRRKNMKQKKKAYLTGEERTVGVPIIQENKIEKNIAL